MYVSRNNYILIIYTLTLIYCIFYYMRVSRVFLLEPCTHVKISGEASPTFGHANANFSVFTDRIRNQFLKK